MADYKKIGMTALEYGLGGVITVFGGNWAVPYINKFVTFIPQTALPLVNLSVHQVVAYGAAFAAAWWINKKAFGKPQ